MIASSMIKYGYAVNVNVKGILSMQQKRYMEALNFFHEGLTTLMDTSYTAPCAMDCTEEKYVTSPAIASFPTRGESLGIDRSFQESPGVFLRSPSDKTMITSIPLPRANHSSLQDEVFGLFNRALHFQLDEEDKFGNDEVYSHFLTAVITYNVGLCHQLSALENGDSRVLERGLDFYSMVYTSLTNQGDYLQMYPASLNLILLSLANNIGHIHAFFRRFAETKICNDEIAHRLSVFLSSQEPTNAFDDDYKTFFLNVSLFSTADSLAAPAA